MKPTTLTALKESIAHWKRLATGKAKPEEFIFGDDCALCGKFCDRAYQGCRGCPVKKRTGLPHCNQTPWAHVFRVATMFPCPLTAKASPRFRLAAKLQLNFLKTLLPKKK